MVFTSHIFVYYFLPIVLGLYFVVRPAWRNHFLLGASYLFYGWSNPWWIVLMFTATWIAYFAGGQIARLPAGSRARWHYLAAAVTAELGLLAFFKYLGFFSQSLNVLLTAVQGGALPVWEIVLPVGISFYVFQSLTYVVDIYRGVCGPARSLADFACYVALFPQLIAGPIVRYTTVAAELVQRTHSLDKFASGAALFILGFAKKILLANAVGSTADAVFAADAPSTGDVWFGVTAYAFQIYFDFSAYSDMAIGLGRILGFEFPPNFNSPYRAESITDFWRRWHISLSTFLRDYLYIPLGGNRLGPLRTYVNLIVVMLLGGLWHGANWTFVCWGAFHGVMLAIERMLPGRSLFSWAPQPARIAGTFVLVLFSWVLFRADSLTEAGRLFGRMLFPTPAGGGSLLLAGEIHPPGVWFMMAVTGLFAFIRVESGEWIVRLGVGKIAILALLWVTSLALLSSQGFNPFLYFQF